MTDTRTHTSPPRVLQVGLGAFGLNHLRAWVDAGMRDSYWVVEQDEAKLRQAAGLFGVPSERLGTDFRRLLGRVDVVDIVTPTDNHFDVCMAALEAGKDVFIEKPMTMTAAQAVRVRETVARTGRILQVGYYYRFHPASQRVKAALDNGDLGDIRYLGGSFMGFKRARNDVGVTHTDAVHFIDLFNWLIGRFPEKVYAVVRDHFGRGLEDWSLVVLHYPGGIVGRVESGYIQPGRWRDKVVANAFTTKEIFVCGAKATAEVDYEQEVLHVHRVHHELRQGVWTAVVDGTETLNAGTATPVQMIVAELRAFLDAVRTRQKPSADEITAGVAMAHLVEAIYESARTGQPAAVATTEGVAV